jgi:hypothetical protein
LLDTFLPHRYRLCSWLDEHIRSRRYNHKNNKLVHQLLWRCSDHVYAATSVTALNILSLRRLHRCKFQFRLLALRFDFRLVTLGNVSNTWMPDLQLLSYWQNFAEDAPFIVFILLLLCCI